MNNKDENMNKTRSNAEQLRGLSGRRIKLALQQMQMSHNSEEINTYAEWVQRLADEQDRAIEALARKLSNTKGAGPCDEENGFWPCPLMNPAGDGDDCLNDYGGICWLAWAFTEAGKPTTTLRDKDDDNEGKQNQ